MIPDWAPIAAYVLLNSAAIPAILKMRERRSSSDISLLWQGMLLAGVSIIFAYAAEIREPVFFVGGILNILGIGAVLSYAIHRRIVSSRIKHFIQLNIWERPHKVRLRRE